MWRLLPGLLLAALLTSGRASAQAWSMPGLNDLPALPGVAKDIMHSITSGTPGKYESLAAGRGMVRMDPFNCASPAVPSPLTYWNIDLGQVYSLRGVVMRAMAVPGNGARIEVRAAPTAAELSVYAGGNPICASLLLTVAQLDQPINCSRRMPARFITVSSTDGTALPVCALDALVDTPPPAPPPDASPDPSTDAAAPAPAADADAPPPQSTSSSSAWRQPRQGGPPGPPPVGDHGGSGAVPWAGGKGSAVASAVNQGPAPPRLSSGADAGAPPPRVRPLAPAEVAVMFGAATSAGSGVGGGDLSLGPLRSGLPPRAAAPSGAPGAPSVGMVVGVCFGTFAGSVVLTAALLWAAISGRLGDRACRLCSPLGRRREQTAEACT